MDPIEPVAPSYMEDLKLYQQLVDTCAKDNSKDILPNAGQMHASIAMSKLFDKTSERVRMVVGKFSGEVSNQPNYINSLTQCINRGIKFQVVFLDGRNEDSDAYKALKTAGDNVTFFDANDTLRKQLINNGKPYHFSVFDDNKFRFETDTEGFVAWFSFNDKLNAKSLIKTFDLGIQI
jgi:hypothetical protein